MERSKKSSRPAGNAAPSCSAKIASMLYECRKVQGMVFDVCMDSRSPRLLGQVLKDLAEMESQMDRVYDRIHMRLPKLPRVPNTAALLRQDQGAT